ncbi:MAG: hypothetical protein HY903_03035 [Deltaproteobacteria bacterium]|nr:hypothetical protein [Deltaproteobacteria bacterium]
MSRGNLALALLLSCTWSCNGSVTTGNGGQGSACVKDSDCNSGVLCISGTCQAVCIYDSNCEPGNVCRNGSCVPGTPTGEAPIIETANGSGSIDVTGGHTERHLMDRLVVTGQHLLGAEATLTGIDPPRAATNLVACNAGTDTRVELALPTDIVKGSYLLTFSNQAGACNANLSLLQGEPGSLDASGAQIVTSINNTLAADPTLVLRGGLAGDVTTISAIGASTPGERSVLINGVEQVGAGENSSAGLYLVILDLVTRQVVNQSAGSGMWSKGPFATTEAQKLRDVLLWAANPGNIPNDYVVVLASAGNIQGLAADGQLVLALHLLGASSTFDALGAGDGYVLVGKKSVGDSNGLEAVSNPSSNGVATLATMAIDRSVVGMTVRRQTPPGLIGFFAGACPPGWSEYQAARGRTVVGLPAGGSVEGMVGVGVGNQGLREITAVPQHTHGIDPPNTTSTAVGAHNHGVDPPSTTSVSGGGHNHEIRKQGGSSIVAPTNTSVLSPGQVWAGDSHDVSSGSGSLNETPLIAAAGHTHGVDVAAFNSTDNGGHAHDVDVGAFTSAAAGAASVDVTMPYIQLRACRKD